MPWAEVFVEKEHRSYHAEHWDQVAEDRSSPSSDLRDPFYIEEVSDRKSTRLNSSH